MRQSLGGGGSAGATPAGFAAIVVVLMLVSGSAGVSAQEFLGRTVADVQVEVAGIVVNDPALIELVETRIGEPLTMINIRSTIDHLVGLGRFEDVRVFGSPADQGVIVRWRLTPVRRISAVDLEGDPQLSAPAIRAVLADRFGTQPSVARVPDMVRAVEAYYAERGFRLASIAPRVDSDGPEWVRLVLTVNAGSRAAVRSVTVTTTELVAEAEVLRRLELQRGRPFDQTALDSRIARFEEDLRGRGYFEARVRESHDFSAEGTAVTVLIDVAPGPHVRVVFEGDALAGDPETLVPIRAERSADQDLLEDASRRIEDALRREGYRSAQAPFARRQQGDEVIVTFSVTRGRQHRVSAVDVSGMSGLDRGEIAALLQVKAGDVFVEARVGAVAAAIAELYRVRGFTQATVRPVIQVLPEEARGGTAIRPVEVRFDVQEGVQTLVTGITFAGASALAPAQLEGQVTLSSGRPFYRPQLSADRDALQRAYRNLGYQNAAVTPQLVFADGSQGVAVTWAVVEGPQILVDRVLIKGNARTSIDLIRREVTVRRGSPMSDDALIDSQRALAATGLFRRVRVSELPRTGSATRDVLVDLEEAPPTTISYGGGFEVGRIGVKAADGQATEELDIAPRGFFDISRRNLWGKNRSVSLFGRVTLRKGDAADPTAPRSYGFNDYRGLFTFREPRAFGTAGDAQLTAFIEQGLRTSFDFNRKGVTSDYARRFSGFTVTGRYTFDYTKLFNEKIAAEDQLLIDRLFPQVKLSKVFGSILRDSRDDVLDPQQGSVLGLDASVAAKAMGSEVGFIKTFAQGFAYRRLPGRGFVLAAGARVGVAIGFKQDVPVVQEIAQRAVAGRDGIERAESRAAGFPTVIRELPASERFFAGGDTTVRGFALDRLGTPETLDPQGFPQGGNGLAVFNLEARAPYWKNLQFVWFTDAGNVFKTASDLRLTDLRVTSGIGFRYRSPIGPLRVDWGFKISTRLLLTGGRERSNVLHISLGQAF